VTAVPLARRGLTALFGMGRGEHPRYNHHYFSSALRLLLLIGYQQKYLKALIVLLFNCLIVGQQLNN
jgi:hypothetical protein